MQGAFQALGLGIAIFAVLAVLAGAAAVFALIGVIAGFLFTLWIIGCLLRLLIEELWTSWRTSRRTRKPP